MPRVPVFEESQRLRPQNPTGFRSVDAAGAEGQGLVNLGRGIASAAGTLSEHVKRRDAADKALAQSFVNNAMTEQVQSLLDERLNSNDNGAKDVDVYNKDSKLAKEFVLKNMVEKFGDSHALEMEAMADKMINGGRDQVFTIKQQKQTRDIKLKKIELDRQYSGYAYNQPNSIAGISKRASEDNIIFLRAFGASEAAIKESNNILLSNLRGSAIRGYVDKGEFDKARNLLKSSTPELKVVNGKFEQTPPELMFTSDELKELNEVIDRAEEHKFVLDQRHESAAQKKKEEEAKLAFNFEANALRSELLEAQKGGNTAKVTQLFTRIKDLNDRMDIPASKFGALISDYESADTEVMKTRDDLNSYDITKDFVKINSAEGFTKLENKVHKLAGSGSITNKKAEQWLKAIHKQKQILSKTPSMSLKIRAAEDKLKVYSKSEDLLVASGIGAKDPSTLNKYFGSHSKLKFLIAEGIDPDRAADIVIAEFFPTGAITISGYSQDLLDLEDVKDAKEWAKSLPIKEFEAKMEEINKAEATLIEREKTKARQDRIKLDEAEAKKERIIREKIDEVLFNNNSSRNILNKAFYEIERAYHIPRGN